MTIDQQNLHSKDRFSDRVDTYASCRPSYPGSLIELLETYLPADSRRSAADIGSGTGILSGTLLGRGFTVFAVEPNRRMREAAELELSGNPSFRSIDGEAGNTTLETRSVDAVTAAQSFHWFANNETVREFDRILRPGGVIMLVWNERQTDIDAFHRRYESLLMKYCPEYSTVDHRNIDERTVESLFKGWVIRKTVHSNSQSFDVAGLRGRVDSSSYAPKNGTEEHKLMLVDLEELFRSEQSDGHVRMKYKSIAYFLKRADSRD